MQMHSGIEAGGMARQRLRTVAVSFKNGRVPWPGIPP